MSKQKPRQKQSKQEQRADRHAAQAEPPPPPRGYSRIGGVTGLALPQVDAIVRTAARTQEDADAAEAAQMRAAPTASVLAPFRAPPSLWASLSVVDASDAGRGEA